MKYTKKQYDKLVLTYHNSDPFERGVIEFSSEPKKLNGNMYSANTIGYVHSENPSDPNVLYINFNEDNKRGGIKLKDYINTLKGGKDAYDSDKKINIGKEYFLNFLQDLYEEEIKTRKIEE